MTEQHHISPPCFDCLYPRCLRNGARGSMAEAVAIGLADRWPPAGASKEQGEGALQMFAGQHELYRPGWCALCLRGAMCLHVQRQCRGHGWCGIRVDGCAVVQHCSDERVKRLECGAPSLYSLLVPAGNKRTAVPSARDRGVEPRRPGRWQRGKRRRRAYEVGWCGSCCRG